MYLTVSFIELLSLKNGNFFIYTGEKCCPSIKFDNNYSYK